MDRAGLPVRPVERVPRERQGKGVSEAALYHLLPAADGKRAEWSEEDYRSTRPHPGGPWATTNPTKRKTAMDTPHLGNSSQSLWVCTGTAHTQAAFQAYGKNINVPGQRDKCTLQKTSSCRKAWNPSPAVQTAPC